MTHLIRQQFLHVDFQGSEQEALALQRRLQHFCRDYLIPALESGLDRHAPIDRHLCLERIDLDIGRLPVERLEYDLAGSISRALERSLQEELSGLRGAPRYKSPQQTLAEAFLFFLERGSLPWWFRLPSGRNLEEALLDCRDEAPGAEGWIPQLSHAAAPLLRLSPVRRRLILQFSHPFREAMLAAVSPEAAAAVAAILRRTEGAKLTAAMVERWREELHDAAFAAAAEGVACPEERLVAMAWRQISPSDPERGELASQMELYWPGAIGAKLGSLAGVAAPPGAVEPAAQKVRSGSGSAAGWNTLIAENEGIYVDNAGLALLHPFLPQLFQALRVATDDRLLQPERALGLLHYLSSGQTKAPEYELLLPKILCGVDLQAPVAAEVGLTAAEREECDALLEAVIRHWGALGQSSPDALRGTFLLRPGKLTLRGDRDWLLQVESSGCDVLLDQLPWSISTIRLPWMESLLWVEWVA